tara:strand:+ start:770 stop:931 length:162 start_codon:yes stop_codon:yes gene_type:complete
MKSIVLEIRASEGGEDSKLLVGEMVNIYTKAARVNNFECKEVESRDGFASLCL